MSRYMAAPCRMRQCLLRDEPRMNAFSLAQEQKMPANLEAIRGGAHPAYACLKNSDTAKLRYCKSTLSLLSHSLLLSSRPAHQGNCGERYPKAAMNKPEQSIRPECA